MNIFEYINKIIIIIYSRRWTHTLNYKN